MKERDGVESEVCDSVTHKVQFNVNCQMISYKDYLIKYLKFSEVRSEGGLRRRKRMQGRRRNNSGGHGGRKASEMVDEGR